MLGRPPKDETLRKEQKRQQAQDERDRNIIEGKFGQAKRCFSLKRIMARLADSSRIRCVPQRMSNAPALFYSAVTCWGRLRGWWG